MKPRDYILSQIQHKQTDRVPYTLYCEPEVESRINAYYGSDQWRKRLVPYIDSPLHCDTIQEVRIDGTYLKDGFGAIWRTDKLPWHLERVPLPEPTFKNYQFPPISQFTDPIYRSVEEAQRKIKENPDSFQIIHMGWGIFEQTWRIRGFENALMDIALEPDFYQELLERITEIYIAMVRACVDVPADAFLFGDDWGEQRGVIIGPHKWRKFIKPCWKKVYDEVHKQGKYVMSHCCGSIADIMDDVIEIGLDVYESVQPEAAGMNSYELKKKWGDKIAFWGCLGTQSIIPFGTPEQLKDEIIHLCTEVGRNGGFIIAPTKPLMRETPTANAIAIVETFINKTV